MNGRIFISGSFTTVDRNTCGQGGGWVDNDPHLWDSPPTWGICRPDLRKLVHEGDYVFFVLPRASELPQTVYAYLRAREIITHMKAYNRPELRMKRMRRTRRGQPNGNIIVTRAGQYNELDGNPDHKRRFDSIKRHYVIGDAEHSRLLSRAKIEAMAPAFADVLYGIFGVRAPRPIGVISRWGRVMTDSQANELLSWLRGS